MYYDGTKLLSMLDINGLKPDVYMASTNRTDGKTTFFSKMVVSHHLKRGTQFALLVRKQTELDGIAEGFFDELSSLFFKGKTMEAEPMFRGAIRKLYIDGVPAGFAIPLTAEQYVKKNSHLFYNVDEIMFDEYQTLDIEYLPDEISRFYSIHKSISRGGGKQVRRVPVYLLSNEMSIVNPYYIAMNVSERITSKAKYIRGNGWVLQRTINESVQQQAQETGFYRAFSDTEIAKHSTFNTSFLDKEGLIEKMSGNYRYIATLVLNESQYAVKLYNSIIYIDKRAEPSGKIYTSDSNLMSAGMSMIPRALKIILKEYFEKGCVRFYSQDCKSAFFKSLKV